MKIQAYRVLDCDLDIFESVAKRMGVEPYGCLIGDAEDDATTHDHKEHVLHDYMRLHTHGSFVDAAIYETSQL